MQNLLEIAEDRKKEAESRLEQLKAQHLELQEELQCTKNNYETQLSTLTEHLATMNEKLAEQKDQIDQLNYQLTNKVLAVFDLLLLKINQCEIQETYINLSFFSGFWQVKEMTSIPIFLNKGCRSS